MEISFKELRRYGVKEGYTKEQRILARRILREIRDRKIVSTITYAKLLPDINFRYPPNRTLVGEALGLIWGYCEEEGYPLINFLVVRADTDLPGAGVIGWYKKTYGSQDHYKGYCELVAAMVTYHLVNKMLTIEEEEE